MLNYLCIEHTGTVLGHVIREANWGSIVPLWVKILPVELACHVAAPVLCSCLYHFDRSLPLLGSHCFALFCLQDGTNKAIFHPLLTFLEKNAQGLDPTYSEFPESSVSPAPDQFYLSLILSYLLLQQFSFPLSRKFPLLKVLLKIVS